MFIVNHCVKMGLLKNNNMLQGKSKVKQEEWLLSCRGSVLLGYHGYRGRHMLWFSSSHQLIHLYYGIYFKLLRADVFTICLGLFFRRAVSFTFFFLFFNLCFSVAPRRKVWIKTLSCHDLNISTWQSDITHPREWGFLPFYMDESHRADG